MRTWVVVVLAATTFSSLAAQENPREQPPSNGKPSIPETWDDERVASLELPLAQRDFSPVHVPNDYYKTRPVRPIYKSYDVYHPDREPKGYFEWLQKQDPVVLWDDKAIPPLRTEADWIAAGELVFDSPLGWGLGGFMGPRPGPVLSVRDPAWYKDTDVPVTGDGKVPFYRYEIRTKGQVRVSMLACALCHTRVMPDKTVIKGAQGNFPFGKEAAYDLRHGVPDFFSQKMAQLLYGTPYLKPDLHAGLGAMSSKEMAAVHELVPAGVLPRHGSSFYSPVQVPDLIGVKDRKYLDRTGLVRQRDIGDLMRYAALNQDVDSLSRYGDWRPGMAFAPGILNRLPPPQPPGIAPGGRYSDTQLYALATYLYSLKPPANPNLPKTDAERERVTRGAKLFSESGCVKCHDPAQGYTNNKLVRAPGFTVPEDHPEKANILAQTVGTDPTLALRTRRGTGLYKVPSLKGVWYRGPFEHNGSVATLEDWFDPKRLEDSYVPTGWKGPPGSRTRAVKGHEFGLDLSAEDRAALIAFLKTL